MATYLWWKLPTIITCGTLAGAIIPELVKIFTSTEFEARAGSGCHLARGRSIAEYSFRFDGRKFQRVLDGA